MARFTEEEKTKIKEMIDQGFDYTQIGREVGRDKSVICRYCRKYLGMPLQLMQYSLNDSVFSNIDTPEKAYWLGYLYCDGCVSSKRYQILLSSIDKEHLYKYQEFLGLDKDLIRLKSPMRQRIILGRSVSCQDCWSVNFSSKKMKEGLARHGVVPIKTYVDSFQMIQEHQSHYLRGMIDADGYLSLYKRPDRKKPVRDIGLCNRESTLLVVKEYLNSIGFNRIAVYPHGSSFQLKITAKDEVLRFLDYLYKDAPVYLERKYQKYQGILEFYREEEEESEE